MSLVKKLSLLENGKQPLSSLGRTPGLSQALDKRTLTSNAHCAFADMPERHLDAGFEGTRPPRDRPDPPVSEIENAVTQFTKEDILDRPPLAQNSVALGAADERELLNILRDFQPDCATGGTFEAELVMSHFSDN